MAVLRRARLALPRVLALRSVRLLVPVLLWVPPLAPRPALLLVLVLQSPFPVRRMGLLPVQHHPGWHLRCLRRRCWTAPVRQDPGMLVRPARRLARLGVRLLARWKVRLLVQTRPTDRQGPPPTSRSRRLGCRWTPGRRGCRRSWHSCPPLLEHHPAPYRARWRPGRTPRKDRRPAPAHPDPLHPASGPCWPSCCSSARSCPRLAFRRRRHWPHFPPCPQGRCPAARPAPFPVWSVPETGRFLPGRLVQGC